jgi:hypothetical protein
LTRFIALIAALAALALVVAGCGDSDDSTTDSGTTDSGTALTKAEFVKQGNAICAAGNKEIDAGFESFAKENNLNENQEPTEAQFEEVAQDILVPAVSTQIEGLRGLGTPKGDNGEVDQILTNAEDALGEIEDDPSKISGENGDPFASVNKEARAYGLTACGEE